MTADPHRPRSDALEIGRLLRSHPGLRLRPIPGKRIRITGTLAFSASARGCDKISDSFEVEVVVPDAFPDALPSVRETGGRVPKTFHTNPDGTLCLGSPTAQRLQLVERPTILAFLQHCIIPYFYGFSHFEKTGKLPLGELAHGWKGIRQDYGTLFGIRPTSAAVIEMIRLASIKKRVANKYPCPCGRGSRLGKCHNRKVNLYRNKLGRRWFRSQHLEIASDK